MSCICVYIYIYARYIYKLTRRQCFYTIVWCRKKWNLLLRFAELCAQLGASMFRKTYMTLGSTIKDTRIQWSAHISTIYYTIIVYRNCYAIYLGVQPKSPWSQEAVGIGVTFVVVHFPSMAVLWGCPAGWNNLKDEAYLFSGSQAYF